MSKEQAVQEFRPRLNSREIQFLIQSLKHTLAFVDMKEQEIQKLDLDVRVLQTEARRGDTRVWKQLKEAKEKLERTKGLTWKLARYRAVCNNLIRRLEGLLKGRRLHSGRWTDFYLRQILSQTAPKTPHARAKVKRISLRVRSFAFLESFVYCPVIEPTKR